MRCYKCGSVLSETDYCNSCGADVTIYKKIIKLSNTYYNMGLEKAKIRDLSGAADLLRRSIRMDKKNIPARNLLGLVYYEMGEFVEALGQWVISKNLQPEKNIADKYIKEAQSNPARLDAMNTTIKKYNTSLAYAKEGSDDLAIIQLKKVIAMNPKFVKAYQLLALLYMKKEEYNKAKKLLNRALKIDNNSTLCIKYLEEIDKATQGVEIKEEEKEEKKILSGNDVIIPETGYKDVNYGVMQFITAVVGILIGAAMVYFLIVPAKENRTETEYRKTINEQQDNISRLKSSLEELQGNVDDLTKENESMAAILGDDKGNNKDDDNGSVSNAEQTSLLMEAAQDYAEGNTVDCALKLVEIGETDDMSKEFVSLYNKLMDETAQDAYNKKRDEGRSYEEVNDFIKARAAFEVCDKLQPDNIEILFHLGQAEYRINGNKINDASRAYFEKVVEIAPDSDYAGWTTSFLN